MDEIVNKVAQSSLKIFDLEDYYPSENIVSIDISQWLFEGVILKEKEFRAYLKEFDFSSYTNQFVFLVCNNDAILPSWAFMLVASYLQPFAKFVIQGSKTDLLIAYYQNKIDELNFDVYQDQSVIIKGCSKKQIPEEVYVLAVNKMMNYAKSIMFGEACSAVPIYKRKK